MDIKEAIAFGQYSGHESPQRILADKVIELEREIARVQMELDASCNAEELRQYRHANQFLIVNQGAYERDNARLTKELFRATSHLAEGKIIDASMANDWVVIRVDTPPMGFRIGEQVRVMLPNV